MLDFHALAQQCAPAVHPATMAAVVRVESTFNPFAIGVVGSRLKRQPANRDEAVATAKALEAAGHNFSLGIGQVNRYNLSRYGLDYQTAFEPCANLHAASRVLKDCYDRARAKRRDGEAALQAAFSCYYSGNFSTGFQADIKGQPSYVEKVLGSAAAVGPAGRVPPARLIPTARSPSSPNGPPGPEPRTGDVFRVTVHAAGKHPEAAATHSPTVNPVMVFR